ncbi:MAG: dihydrofolate reductase family protein [Acidobacteriaceae bacterium]
MRKIYMFNRTSIDGFFADLSGNIDWSIPDPAVDHDIHQMMSLDSILFGRLTYQMFESYWPMVARDPNAPAGARAMANELDTMNKVVFSRTLSQVTWENSRLVNGHLVEEVKRLKRGQGRDLVIFGSGSIVQQLACEDLIDEYLILVTPVILGVGKSLFHGVDHASFKLAESRTYSSGNVLLHYVLNGNAG